VGEKTEITWCDHTFNPWWGCVRVSEACRNCYAEAFDRRFVNDKSPPHWGPNAPRRFFGDKHWDQPRRWNAAAEKAGERRRVFCASMADVFEDRQDLIPHRRRLWNLILATPHLDWLLLTKRPENFSKMLPWYDAGIPSGFPWSNVWLGVTAEDNGRAEERILTLRGIQADVRFVSCEPILEFIGADTWDLTLGYSRSLERIHWLIIGDESGHSGRPADVEWVRVARDAAQRHGVAFHFKQWAGRVVPPGIANPNGVTYIGQTIHLPMLDGESHSAFPRTR